MNNWPLELKFLKKKLWKCQWDDADKILGRTKGDVLRCPQFHVWCSGFKWRWPHINGRIQNIFKELVPVLSEADIEKAFKLIDVDKNGETGNIACLLRETTRRISWLQTVKYYLTQIISFMSKNVIIYK